MNPAELYEEFVMAFPPVHPEDHEWVNIHDGVTLKPDALSRLVDECIAAPEVLLVVHSEPGVGALLPRAAVGGYIAEHVLHWEIQMADPSFESFVAVSLSGVATGWQKGEVRPAPPVSSDGG